MINTPYKQLEKRPRNVHPGMQFLIFTGIFIGLLLLGNLIGGGIAAAIYGLNILNDLSQLKLSSPNTINALWILQIAGTTLPILGAPVIFAYAVVRDAEDYLKPTFRIPWLLLVLVFAVMFISQPVIELLSNLNQKMVLPPFLQWMRESEDQAQKLTEAMLQMKTIGDMLFDLLIIGLVTAIVEEFMFRGCIQTIFTRWTKSHHAAIWITAILFSAFHIEFFGFLPRLMLGVLFGYFVAWSGSIWPGVWAHFLNNGTAVVATYLFKQKLIKVNPDDQHLFNYSGYVLSVGIMFLLMLMYRKTAAGTPEPEE